MYTSINDKKVVYIYRTDRTRPNVFILFLSPKDYHLANLSRSIINFVRLRAHVNYISLMISQEFTYFTVSWQEGRTAVTKTREEQNAPGRAVEAARLPAGPRRHPAVPKSARELFGESGPPKGFRPTEERRSGAYT